MSHSMKKQEEQDLKKIRDLLRLSDNKKCFECAAKSPFFVDMTIQTFVCARCSGLVREVGHRVKSISTSKFSGPETTSLEMGGNATGKRIWLRGYGNNNNNSNEDNDVIESDYDVRLFMRQKYYDQRWLDKALWNEHCEKTNKVVLELYTEDGIPRSGLSGKRRFSSRVTSTTASNFTLQPPPSSSTPISIKYASSNTSSTTTTPSQHQQQTLFDDDDDSWMTTAISSPIATTNTSTLNDPFDIWSAPIKTTNPTVSTTPIQPLIPPPPSSSSSSMKLSSQPPSIPLDPFAALRDLSL